MSVMYSDEILLFPGVILLREVVAVAAVPLMVVIRAGYRQTLFLSETKEKDRGSRRNPRDVTSVGSL